MTFHRFASSPWIGLKVQLLLRSMAESPRRQARIKDWSSAATRAAAAGPSLLTTLLLDDYPTLYTIAEATSRLEQRNYLRVVKAHLLLVVMGH
jgi:hypothetical protein